MFNKVINQVQQTNKAIMQEDRGKVQEDQINLSRCHLAWFHTSCNQRLLTSHRFFLKNYFDLAMIILFKLQGKVTIAASGPADKIHPSSFQQTNEQLRISRIPDTLRIKYNFGGQAVEDPRTVSQNALYIVSIYPMTLHWSTLSGKRTNFRKVSMLWFLFTQRKNFTCSILLCHSMEIGPHQMVPLIFKDSSLVVS